MTPPPTPPQVRGNEALFQCDGRYAGKDSRISVGGDFNGWNPESSPMHPEGNGLYRTRLHIPIPSDYHYKFFADGKWIPDPSNPRREPDGYGGEHSVISITGESQATEILKALEAALEVVAPGARSGVRQGLFQSLDALLQIPASSKCGCLKNHFLRRFDRFLNNLHRPCTGIILHHLYSAGVILQTKRLRIAMDLVTTKTVWDVRWEIPEERVNRLAEMCDILLVTHRHPDHLDMELVRHLLKKGKPVVGPAELVGNILPATAVPARAGETLRVGGMTLRAHPGVHVYDKGRNLSHRTYEFEPAKGLNVLFTGDHDYTARIDFSSPPSLLLAKYGGISPSIKDPLAWSRLIERTRPSFAIPIHLEELGHPLGGGRIPYTAALEALAGDRCAGDVMHWGENYPLPLPL